MPVPNRSVYVIGAPHRDWFLRADPPDRHTKTSWCFIGPALRLKPPGKNHCAVRAAPGTAGGLPPGVTVFANARINYLPLNPASHHECKNTRHRDSAPTPHTAER